MRMKRIDEGGKFAVKKLKCTDNPRNASSLHS